MSINFPLEHHLDTVIKTLGEVFIQHNLMCVRAQRDRFLMAIVATLHFHSSFKET